MGATREGGQLRAAGEPGCPGTAVTVKWGLEGELWGQELETAASRLRSRRELSVLPCVSKLHPLRGGVGRNVLSLTLESGV